MFEINKIVEQIFQLLITIIVMLLGWREMSKSKRFEVIENSVSEIDKRVDKAIANTPTRQELIDTVRISTNDIKERLREHQNDVKSQLKNQNEQIIAISKKIDDNQQQLINIMIKQSDK